MDGELTYQAWATNYENELPKIKPCPFCGGEDVSVDAGYWDTHGARYEVGCDNPQCAVHPCSDLYPTEAEAIAAWNNRAERTCHDVKPSLPFFKCDSCGMEDMGGKELWIQDGFYRSQKPNYCPNCGARVVSE